jgi:hypothetical protein
MAGPGYAKFLAGSITSRWLVILPAGEANMLTRITDCCSKDRALGAARKRAGHGPTLLQKVCG